MADASKGGAQARPFMDFLRDHRRGKTHDDLSVALQALTAAVQETGRAGTMTLTIGVKPMGKGDGLEVSTQVKVQPPKEAPGVSIYFADPNNNLVREDPRQQAMELRDIKADEKPREIA